MHTLEAPKQCFLLLLHSFHLGASELRICIWVMSSKTMIMRLVGPSQLRTWGNSGMNYENEIDGDDEANWHF